MSYYTTDDYSTTEPVKLVLTAVEKEFVSKKFPNATPKFVAGFLIRKDSDDFKELRKLVSDVVANAYKGKKKLDARENPFKEASSIVDVEKLSDHEDYAFIKATSTNQPGLVDTALRPVDPKKFKNGCMVRVNVNAFSWATGGEGVSFGLNHVQFVESGESVSGGAGPGDPKKAFGGLGGAVADAEDQDVDSIFG